MAGDARDQTGFSLRRWSQRKLAAQRDARSDENARVDPVSQRPGAPITPATDLRRQASGPPAMPAERDATAGTGSAASSAGTTGGDMRRANAAGTAAAGTAAPLPPVESLTFDSDFSAFMRADVDETLRRTALRKLLRDSRFNVMDGLDVYIDDYSTPSPIEADVVRGLMQARHIFAPPKTRVTADGCVEDVPEEAPTAEASAETASTRETASAPTALASAEGEAQAPIADASVDASPIPDVPAKTPSTRE
jgi:hypothetical protein